MALILYTLSGSPYAWRVWLGLEYKAIPYKLKLLSFDAGDFQKPEFLAIAPRGRVPIIEDDGFVLAESAAIMEYLEDSWPQQPGLFSIDLHERAQQRRMIREADQYFAAALEHLADAVLFTPEERRSPQRIDVACENIQKELAIWETAITGDFLAGALSAVDFTLYPQIALIRRIAERNPSLMSAEFVGPKMSDWMARMDALPLVQKTWPPHWNVPAA